MNSLRLFALANIFVASVPITDAASPQSRATTDANPNIVFILMDNLGYGRTAPDNSTINVLNFLLQVQEGKR